MMNQFGAIIEFFGCFKKQSSLLLDFFKIAQGEGYILWTKVIMQKTIHSRDSDNLIQSKRVEKLFTDVSEGTLGSLLNTKV